MRREESTSAMSQLLRSPRPRGCAALIRPLVVATMGALIAATAGAVPIQITLPTVTGPPGATVNVPLAIDQDITGLSIYSIEYHMPIDPAIVSGASFLDLGVINNWGTPFRNVADTVIAVVGAGFTPVSAYSPWLDRLHVTISPTATPGADMPLTLSVLTFNEGSPASTFVSGVLHVRTTVDVAPGRGAGFALHPVVPNPVASEARIAFSIPGDVAAGDRVRLAIFGLDGRRVRTLVDGSAAGPGSARWDARDDAGRPLAPGVYLCRLEWRGQHVERKLALVR